MRRAILFVALLVLAGCNASGPDGTPALWEARRDDDIILLFGTMHVVPKGARWSNDAIRDGLAASDTLVLEIADDSDAETRQALFDRLGRSPGLPGMAERLDAPRAAQLAKTLSSHPATAHALPAYEDWAAALIIGATTQQVVGLSSADAPEACLANAARRAAKPIAALETREGQLALFDRLPPSAQADLLNQAVDDAADPHSRFDALYRAWFVGDMATIERRFAEQLGADRANGAILSATLIDRRNKEWAERIDKWAQQRPVRLFVAVGAGHMIGDQGLPALLEAEGFTVRRIQ